MSEAIKPTLGEWYAKAPDPEKDRENGDSPKYMWRVRTKYPARLGGCVGHEVCEITHLNTGHEESDAKLFAEAGNTFHATGQTPRQLAEQVKVLREALNSIIEDMDSEYGTDYDYNKARAALAATDWSKT